MSKLEQQIKQTVKSAGYDISSNQLKDLIKEYNNYSQPITVCLANIYSDPSDFLKFLNKKEL